MTSQKEPVGPDIWHLEAKRLLRLELKRHHVGYKKLAELLNAIGVSETERSIANKMARGTFSFVFYLQCLKAMGAGSTSFEEGREPVRHEIDV
jgi:hypothetical protein